MKCSIISHQCIIGIAAFLSLGCAKVWADGAAIELQGKSLSETHCSRCHVVNESNRFGGISSTPSFSLMVNGLDDWQERFNSFHTRLPHPSIVRFKEEALDETNVTSSVPVILEYTDIQAIAAYAKTLLKN